MRTAARSLRSHRPTARATRPSGPDGASLVAQLRDRHGPPRLATAESAARDRAAPCSRSTVLSSRTAEGADANPIVVHRLVPRIERDHRHGAVRAVPRRTRLGCDPQGRDDRVGGHGAPSSADPRQRAGRRPQATSRPAATNGRFKYQIHVRLGRRLGPETGTDWTLKKAR